MHNIIHQAFPILVMVPLLFQRRHKSDHHPTLGRQLSNLFNFWWNIRPGRFWKPVKHPLSSNNISFSDSLLFRPAESTLSDDDSSSSSANSEEENGNGNPPTYSFPQLDEQIRAQITQHEAVFPKLNWSSPKVRCPSHLRSSTHQNLSLSLFPLSFRMPHGSFQP